MSGVPFRGVSAEQDGRFGDKERKLLRKLSNTFPPEFKEKPDLKRVQWESIKPWIATRTTELLGGVEDEVLIGYVIEQIENKTKIDPRILQINLTGFLEKNASVFCKELWNLLLSAGRTESGIPQQFLDEKVKEIRQREEQRQRMYERIERERRRQDELHREYDRSERHRRSRDRRRRRSPSRSRSRSREYRRERMRSRERNSGEEDRRRGRERHRSPHRSGQHKRGSPTYD